MWDIFGPRDKGIDVWTRYLSARKVENLFTGFAYVTLLEFHDKDGELVTLESKIYTVEKKGEIRGYCYRLYELGLGFPSLSSALAQYKSSEEGETLQPSILSVNTVEARSSTKGRGQLACDLIDVGEESRRERLLAQMREDKQWDWQEASATARIRDLVALHPEVLETVEVLTDDSNLPSDAETIQISARAEGGPEQRTLRFRQTAPIRLKMPQESVATSVSQFAKLELTFSTVGLFNSKRRIFLLWTAEDFYIRKDVSRVTYGSSLTSVSRGESRTWWKPWTWFEPNRIVIKMEKPRQIAIDRRIDTLVQTPKFEFDPREHKDKSIEDYMREDLEKILAAFEERAVAETERLMRFSLSRLEDSELEIEIDFSER